MKHLAIAEIEITDTPKGGKKTVIKHINPLTHETDLFYATYEYPDDPGMRKEFRRLPGQKGQRRLNGEALWVDDDSVH